MPKPETCTWRFAKVRVTTTQNNRKPRFFLLHSRKRAHNRFITRKAMYLRRQWERNHSGIKLLSATLPKPQSLKQSKKVSEVSVFTGAGSENCPEGKRHQISFDLPTGKVNTSINTLTLFHFFVTPKWQYRQALGVFRWARPWNSFAFVKIKSVVPW